MQSCQYAFLAKGNPAFQIEGLVPLVTEVSGRGRISLRGLIVISIWILER
jgi:hypothetical protein